MLAIGGEDDDKVLQQADAGNARGQLVDGQARRGARIAACPGVGSSGRQVPMPYEN